MSSAFLILLYKPHSNSVKYSSIIIPRGGGWHSEGSGDLAKATQLERNGERIYLEFSTHRFYHWMVQCVPGVSLHCLETARKHGGCQLGNWGLLAKAVFLHAYKHKHSSPCSAPIRIDGQHITSCHWGTAGQESGHSLLWSLVCLNHLWISAPASLYLLAIPSCPSGCQLTFSPPYLKLLPVIKSPPLIYIYIVLHIYMYSFTYI